MTLISNMLASAAKFEEIELEFPNLFGGTQISYYRGFELFGIPIYWYGVLITLGVVLAYLYAMARTKDFGLDRDRVFDVVFAALIGGFIGARAYYCIFATLEGTHHYTFITAITEIRDGGLAIYGGIIAALLVGALMCRVRKVKLAPMFDLAALGFLIGQSIGRWGNFVNQEAHGGITDPDYIFGMSGDLIRLEAGITGGDLVHPCFLYESMWCLLGFIGLHFYSKKLRSYDGEVFLLYIAWYGLGRVFIEGMRTDSLMAGDLKISQIVAGASFVAALVLFIIFKVITEQKKIPLYVNTEECAKLLAADRAKDEERAKLRAERKAAKEGVAQSILADDDEPDPDDGEFKDDSEYQDEIIDYTDDNNDNSDENDSGDTAENEDTDENNESEEE